jgi:hypothetical protein
MAPPTTINIAEAYDGRTVLITGATGEGSLPCRASSVSASWCSQIGFLNLTSRAAVWRAVNGKIISHSFYIEMLNKSNF